MEEYTLNTNELGEVELDVDYVVNKNPNEDKDLILAIYSEILTLMYFQPCSDKDFYNKLDKIIKAKRKA